MDGSGVEPQGNQVLDPVGRLFSGSWRSYKERFWVLMGILIIPVGLMSAGEFSLKYGLPFSSVFTLLGSLLFVMAIPALMLSVAKGSGVGESYRVGLKFFWPSIWLGLLLECATFGGLVMLVIPAVMMSVWFLFNGYVLILEDKSGMGVLSQSREYARGYWWPLFGRYLLLLIPSAVIFFAIYLPVLFIFGSTFGSVVVSVVELLILPFILVYIYKLYQNIVAIKPTLATTQSTSGRGFFITSAIVGFVAVLLVFVALTLIVSTVTFLKGGFLKNMIQQNSESVQPTTDTSTSQLAADLQDPSSWPQMFLGIAGTQMSHLSVGLPPGYGIRYMNASAAFIKRSPLYPFGVQVTIVKGTLSEEIAAAKSVLSQVETAQNPLVITTSTLAGFPATSLEVVGGNAPAYILTPTQTPTGPSVIVVSKQYDNAEFGDQSIKPLENKIIDDIAASLKFSATGNTSTLMSNAIGTLPSTTMTFGPAQNNTYYIGSSYPITWTTPDWANGQIVEINLWRGNSPCSTDNETGVTYCGVWVGLLHGSNRFNGSYSWQIQDVIIPGNDYRVSVSFNDVAGVQSQPFSIAMPTTAPQTPGAVPVRASNQGNSNLNSAKPSITILSPSGGETWQMGQEQTVKWSSVGVKNLVIFIHFSDGGMCREGILPASAGEYSFVLTPTCPNMPATLISGQYTINITDSDPGSNNPEAWSPEFNIVAQP